MSWLRSWWKKIEGYNRDFLTQLVGLVGLAVLAILLAPWIFKGIFMYFSWAFSLD